MTRDTKIRLALAVMVFLYDGASGLVRFRDDGRAPQPEPNRRVRFFWIPLMIVASSIISAAVSWWIAPHLRARFWRSEGEHSFINISGQGQVTKAGIGGMSTRSTTPQNATLDRSLAAMVRRYCSSAKLAPVRSPIRV